MNIAAQMTVAILLMPVCPRPGLGGKEPNAITTAVYAPATRDSAERTLAAKKLYGGKFRFIDVTHDDGFTPARPKVRPRWTDRSVYLGKDIHETVVVAYIITPDGRAIEPRLIRPPDKRLQVLAVDAITGTFEPARLRGSPVPSLRFADITFAKDSGDNGMGHDGLGIMKSRDR